MLTVLYETPRHSTSLKIDSAVELDLLVKSTLIMLRILMQNSIPVRITITNEPWEELEKLPKMTEMTTEPESDFKSETKPTTLTKEQIKNMSRSELKIWVKKNRPSEFTQIFPEYIKIRSGYL